MVVDLLAGQPDPLGKTSRGRGLAQFGQEPGTDAVQGHLGSARSGSPGSGTEPRNSGICSSHTLGDSQLALPRRCRRALSGEEPGPVPRADQAAQRPRRASAGLVASARAISSQPCPLARASCTSCGSHRSAWSMRLAIRAMTAVSSPAQVPRRSASAATASSMRDSTTCRRLTLPQGEGRSWFMDGRTAEPG